MKKQEMLKGNTETIILSLLQLEPMYGYQLAQEIRTRSSGYFDMKEGTLYPALYRMEREGLIEGRWQNIPDGMRRRYCFITLKGRFVLSDRQAEWQRFCQAMNSVVARSLAQPG